MIPMRLGDVAAAMGAPCPVEFASLRVQGVCTDSRELRSGDLFFAIRGPIHDGHTFVHAAIEKGAVGVVCDQAGAQAIAARKDIPQLVVDDTVRALGRLAAHYRRCVMSVSTVVVGVTGSNGKTTTKAMIDHVLGGSLRGRASPKSFNNRIGLPLTLLSTAADDQYLVAEIGTSAPGEIEELAGMASPEVGVVTSIAEAHLQGLGDIHGVADEKCSLLRHIRLGGLAVVNIDRQEVHPFLTRVNRVRLVTIGVDSSARLCVADRRSSIHQSSFLLDGRFDVELPMPGAHHATNATAAFAVGRWFGIPCEEIIERLATFVPPEGRTRVIETGRITLVDDAYNANPGSVTAAIEALRTSGTGRRVLILGDMLELGDHATDLHGKIVAEVENAGVNLLIGVGKAMSDALAHREPRRMTTLACADVATARQIVGSVLRPHDVVWLKGSRAVGLDQLVRHLESQWTTQAAVA